VYPSPLYIPYDSPEYDHSIGGHLQASWTEPAQTEWHSTIVVYGRSPLEGCCTSLYFGSLNSGELPAGTYLTMVGLNYNSLLDYNPFLEMTAFDPDAWPILTPWLDEPIYVGAGNPADITVANMPRYTFDSSTGKFRFQNSPNEAVLSITMVTNRPIHNLRATQHQSNSLFNLSAPVSDVPEPSTALALSFGIVALLAFARRKR
jgi:hypothetical protein